MTNLYYNPTGSPATGSFGASNPMRSEFALIAAGFAKLPAPVTDGTTAPISGATVQIPDYQDFTSILPAVPLAALTVLLPQNFGDDGRCEFIITQAVTSLTVTPFPGTVINGTAISAAASAAGIVLAYRLQGTTWFREKPSVSGQAPILMSATGVLSLATTIPDPTTFTGAATFNSSVLVKNGLTVNPAGLSVTGASAFSGTLAIQKAAAASTQALRADQAWQVINTYTATGATALAIPLSSSFREFRLTTEQARTANDAKVIGVQFSTDGGGTYKNSLYAWGALSVTTGGVTGGGGSGSASLIPISPGLTNANANGWGATTHIFPGSATGVTSARTEGFGEVSGPAYLYWAGGGTWGGATGLVNYMQVTRDDSGAFTGTFILEGLV